MNPTCPKCGASCMPMANTFLKWQCVVWACKYIVTDDELEGLVAVPKKQVIVPTILKR